MSHQAPIESLLTPFMLEGGQVRGRIVHLGDVANTILSRYEYPQPVVKLLGELIIGHFWPLRDAAGARQQAWAVGGGLKMKL